LYDVLKANISDAEKATLIQHMDNVLSLDLLTPVEVIESEVHHDEVAEIEAMLVTRTQAKLNKDWATADQIRDALKAKNITIIDTPEGAKWKKD
jgi:cysteinyl-tRNA synthetase